ncbi:MAG: serine hydrolase [Roseburia sp.]|nr:serine hydrolase [Roseburia sp.]
MSEYCKSEKLAELEAVISAGYANMAGIVIVKDGRLVYENYFNGCTAENQIHIYSVTKSILSVLVGIAIDKGYIQSVEQKILDFFPDYRIKRGEKNIQKITIGHLLTMTAPYKYHFPPYRKYFTSDDWVTFSLDLLGGKAAGQKFRYAPLIGPDILSGIIVNATGQTVLDFAAEHLFEPLGIHVAGNIIFHSKEEQLAFSKVRDISGWVADSKGVNAGGWGLALSPADMAKIGRLYLDGGVWKGEQLVSEKWIKESTTEHSRWEKQNLPYGYLWWLGEDGESGFAAMGDGGNILYVNPGKGLVVASTAFLVKKPKDRIEFIKKYIEPVFAQGN